MIEISLKRNRKPYEAEYAGATFRLVESGEALLRSWLSRPVQPRYRDLWGTAVASRAEAFVDNGNSLILHPVSVSGKSAEEVVEAFIRVGALACGGLTLRQLSARCFWGHSKLLDTREELLKCIFRDVVIAPRPVLVHSRLAAARGDILFIENQDSYVQALAGIPEGVVLLDLVYVAGFRGSAARIRTRSGASLHYHGAVKPSCRKPFEDWWFGERHENYRLWFWGDLDYAGMAILKALRQRFGDVRAWPAGYDAQLVLLEAGGGHHPELADKTEQCDPGKTGCAYADEILLPALRRQGRFVDQEAT